MIPWDKIGHFAVGFTIFTITAKIAAYFMPCSDILAGIITVAAAVGKELWDATINPVTGKQRGNPDMLDAAATILGGAVAALILF